MAHKWVLEKIVKGNLRAEEIIKIESDINNGRHTKYGVICKDENGQRYEYFIFSRQGVCFNTSNCTHNGRIKISVGIGKRVIMKRLYDGRNDNEYNYQEWELL